ncbi:MAG: hypothetical protein EZS28_002730 [Streblomastix strix]|uniref:Uncharacterized protein n=1 Tax=Streblomastix strix TaxID=222440 RepID=A0A5J4X5D6_9EUKA|nr:MAG: hypothetical protein EZS28_002730 [Streblomastix strix]
MFFESQTDQLEMKFMEMYMFEKVNLIETMLKYHFPLVLKASLKNDPQKNDVQMKMYEIKTLKVNVDQRKNYEKMKHSKKKMILMMKMLVKWKSSSESDEDYQDDESVD